MREALDKVKSAIPEELGIGRGNLEFLEEILEHKSLIGFAYDLGVEVNFFKDNESLAEIGKRVVTAIDEKITRDQYENFGDFQNKINEIQISENIDKSTGELEIFGVCYLVEGLKYHFKNDIYILLEIESKFTNFVKDPKEAIKLLEELKKKDILLDDVEKYFEEKLSLEEREKLEEIMKKYKKMIL
jgi:hypothetical protein